MAGLAAAIPQGALAALAADNSSGKTIAAVNSIGPTILEYLTDLEGAVHQLANTWRPDDPQYRADVYRQIMMNLSYSYFVYFHADAEHPDWAPLWNPVYTMQPNPDDIYLYCPIRGDLKYKVKGNRGTVRLLTFSTSRGTSGMVDDISEVSHFNDLDDRALKIGSDGEFELLFSAEKPAGYSGNWAPIAAEANVMIVRYRSWDWGRDRDPQLSIECLDRVPLKRRLSPDEIIERIRLMAKFPGRMAKMFYDMQNAIKQRVGINVFEPVRIPGGLSKQVYWPAVFELDDGEALIIETELPKVRPYWNMQLNDPYYNAVEYVYRLSSLNGATARISSDGKLRAVIALEDPGVPNWLDSAGFKQGTVYGRWYDCDTNPLAVIKRVPLAKVRDQLPHDTPIVTPEQRATELRERVRAAQRRRRW
ncbi:MAG: DUF1214 domain-containing protein [Rhodospirillaceae bacterium]|nr:MAG: DUF1214 domain-containing protein [Rhodospirillaceae bacterium]